MAYEKAELSHQLQLPVQELKKIERLRMERSRTKVRVRQIGESPDEDAAWDDCSAELRTLLKAGSGEEKDLRDLKDQKDQG